MQFIADLNSKINGIVWGIPMMILILGAGIYLSIGCGFPQFTHFAHIMKNTLGKAFEKSEKKEGAVSPFKAMCTALAASIGTGNIAGVSGAIAIGGPGAVFWMWISALLGMCTKYAEVTLAIKYRERNEKGDWVGGPMYYIKNGLGKNWKWLGAIFCIFGALAAFGIGNAVQVGNITSSINTVIVAFNPDFSNQDTVNLILGILLAALTAVVLFGGIKRLGAVTEKLVPVMAVVYIVSCLAVIISNAGVLPTVFHDIFVGAFSPEGVTGGAVGSLILCITWGVKRGVFSNEAGLGSAPMAHAATSETDPVKQGLYGIFEVFMDTIIVCTLSGLTILCGYYGKGVAWDYGSQGDTSLNAAALGTVFGDKGGAIIIAACLALFAFSTVLSWALYGTRCCEFLFGSKAIRPYQIIFIIIVIVGATMDLGLAWDIADTLNGLMAIPNLIALVGLSGIVVNETKAHFDKVKK